MGGNEIHTKPGRFRVKNEGDSFRKIKRVKATTQVVGGGEHVVEEDVDIGPGKGARVEEFRCVEDTAAILVEIDTTEFDDTDLRTKHLIIDELSVAAGFDVVDLTLRFPNDDVHHYITLVARSGTESWMDVADMEV